MWSRSLLAVLVLFGTFAQASICDGPKYPDQGCIASILDALDAARHTVLVEAPAKRMEGNIQDGIVTARSANVDVRMILDGPIPLPKDSVAAELAWMRVPVWLSAQSAPEKPYTIIIDGKTLITGTFDFPSSATETTPDKLLITHDPALIEKATAQWNIRFAKSEPSDSSNTPQLIGSTSGTSSPPVRLPPLPQYSPTPASSPIVGKPIPQGGIGLFFEKIGADVVVNSVPSTSAAAEAGVAVGDIVLQVDDQANHDSANVFCATLGEPGTKVRLTLVSLGSTKPHTVEIVRDDGRTNNRPTARLRPEPLDPPALAKIVLPEHPTREQARDYIRDILRASGDPSRLRNLEQIAASMSGLSGARPPHVNLQPSLLAKVGRENIDLLIDAAPSRDGGYFIAPAISLIAQPEDIDLLVSRLDRAHVWLLDVFQKRGWTAQAVPALAKIISKNPSGLDDRVFATLVSLRDPATYPDITYCYQIDPRKYKLLDALKQLPGFDVPAAVNQAWEYGKAAHKFDSWGRPEDYEMAVVAATYGHRDALDYLLQCYVHGSSITDGIPTPRDAILSTLDVPPTGELTTWYRENSAHLRFDEEKKKFTVAPLISTPSPTPVAP